MAPRTSSETVSVDVSSFRSRLNRWYRENARELPWRGIHDPYRTWLSEIMLQQTRVAAVIEHYHRFLAKFPTLIALAEAPESEVLAAWSGLGYYRRARMMHQAARHVAQELGGVLPTKSEELRALPGIGAYTSAAIASICSGESIAVVDGNVERVLLRITGRAEDTTAEGRAFIQRQAAALVPPKKFDEYTNAAGDHNQAMMELGATICLPRGPLCLQCPVFDLCHTRGEHKTAPRSKPQRRPIAHMLFLRSRGNRQELLLERRPDTATLMPGMYELPPLPLDVVEGREPVLRVRHAITTSLYEVGVYSPENASDTALQRAIPAAREMLRWTPVEELTALALTGLARKVLRRLKWMEP